MSADKKNLVDDRDAGANCPVAREVDEDTGKTEDLQETENAEGPTEGESGASGGGHSVRGLPDERDSSNPRLARSLL